MAGLVIGNPVKFSTAITSANVLAGDALYLRGGTYSGDWTSSIAGTFANPVTIQPYENEPVTIVGSLAIGGAHTHWQGITVQNPVVASHNSAVYITQAGTWLTNFDISGVALGASWFGSGVGKLVNCAFHDLGNYGIYTHNHLGGAREITGCTFSNIGGYYAIHLFSDGNKVRDYVISGCTINKPTIVHSGVEVSGIQFLNNTFNSWLKFGNSQTASDPRSGVIDGNTFQGTGSGITALSWSELTITDNIMAIVQSGIEKTNVSLFPGANLISTSIDRNAYTSGDFYIDNIEKTFAQWQALGYDAAGTYS
jgi:hypothetical protein